MFALHIYYMASSGLVEMTQIFSCDWVPERVGYLGHSRLPVVFREEKERSCICQNNKNNKTKINSFLVTLLVGVCLPSSLEDYFSKMSTEVI